MLGVGADLQPGLHDPTARDPGQVPCLIHRLGRRDATQAQHPEEPDEDAASPGPDEEAGRLHEVAKGEALGYRAANKEQHFTEPPPRFTEATLVKVLEERGIGRPSTYATIVSTILTRDYIQREKGRLHPTDLGRTVTRLLVLVFSDVFDVSFTARMETDLDRQCDTSRCTSVKCLGPCVAVKYYRKYVRR